MSSSSHHSLDAAGVGLHEDSEAQPLLALGSDNLESEDTHVAPWDEVHPQELVRGAHAGGYVHAIEEDDSELPGPAEQGLSTISRWAPRVMYAMTPRDFQSIHRSDPDRRRMREYQAIR